MFRFNRTLIDPTPDVLGRTLGEAVTAANKGFRARRLAWPVEDLPAFFADWQAERSGQRQWASKRGGPCVAIAWWSDRLGLKHSRVVSAGRTADDLFEPDSGHEDGVGRPPLWKVYPDDLYVWDESNTDEGRSDEEGDWCLWAVCRFGASGHPRDLGWMRPWCSACHDRAEGGTPLTRPGDCRPVVFDGHPFWVENLAFCADGRTLLTSARYHPAIWVWDTLTGEVAVRKLPGRWSKSLAASPNGRTAAGCVDVKIHLWSLTDGTEGPVISLPLADPANDGVALAFSPDGTLLASATHPGILSSSLCQLTVHDSTTGEVRWTTTPYSRASPHWGEHILAFTPDGRKLALGSGRPAVRLWDVVSGKELPAPACAMSELTGFAFSQDGRTLAAGADYGDEDQLKLWDLATGKEKVSLPGPVCALAFSPDGRVLATAGRDGVLRLRDAVNGRMLGAFHWHQAGLTAVAFSPDGHWLVTAAQEERVKLWPVDLLPGWPKAAAAGARKRRQK